MHSLLAPLVSLVLALGGAVSDPLPWDGDAYRTYSDAIARVAIPVPLTQTRVESRHFGATASAAQMTDVLTVSGPEGAEVEVGVWSNPAHLELSAWVSANAPYLLTPDRFEGPGWASGGRIPARRFEHPRSGQQFARRTAVFARGERVFSVTCWNRDDARSAAEFEKILDGIEELP